MSDNNENNIDETVDNVEESVQETDTETLEGDGITEEEVSAEEEENADGVESEGKEKTVTIFPVQQESTGSFADKLKALTQKQIICISAIAVVVIAVIIAIIVLATSGKKADNNVSTTPVSAVTKQSSETASSTSETETTVAVVEPETQVSFEELSQTNEDIYAYIYIPGTNIDYPILQSEGKSESYYLYYTVNNYASWTGAIFTDYTYNSKDFTDKNTIIYGHCATRNINSVMFTQLHYYEDEDFFKQYPYIYIYVGDKQLKYQIFAAVHFTDIMIPYKYGVNSGASMVQFVNDAKTTYGGVIDDSVVIDENSRIITLSTCTMVPNYDESKRFLVIAKLIEEAVVQ